VETPGKGGQQTFPVTIIFAGRPSRGKASVIPHVREKKTMQREKTRKMPKRSNSAAASIMKHRKGPPSHEARTGQLKKRAPGKNGEKRNSGRIGGIKPGIT